MLHHAAQLVAAVGRSLVPPRPDDGYTSLEWVAGALRGPGGSRAAPVARGAASFRTVPRVVASGVEAGRLDARRPHAGRGVRVAVGRGAGARRRGGPAEARGALPDPGPCGRRRRAVSPGDAARSRSSPAGSPTRTASCGPSPRSGRARLRCACGRTTSTSAPSCRSPRRRRRLALDRASACPRATRVSPSPTSTSRPGPRRTPSRCPRFRRAAAGTAKAGRAPC